MLESSNNKQNEKMITSLIYLTRYPTFIKHNCRKITSCTLYMGAYILLIAKYDKSWDGCTMCKSQKHIWTTEEKDPKFRFTISSLLAI